MPSRANAEFAFCMENILQLYHLPYDARFPLVCFDESSKQLIAETRTPLPMKPEEVRRYDYEYERQGGRNLFLFFEPLRAWRHIEVTEQRTKSDFAHCMKDLVDKWYPEAEKIRVVMDNLNTHKPSSLYKTFPPEEARRLLDCLEFHYTPKHGSWLNMAEIEFGLLARQCLDRRIPTQELLVDEVAAWEAHRNEHKTTVNWQFTTTDARIKLKKLYPSLEA